MSLFVKGGRARAGAHGALGIMCGGGLGKSNFLGFGVLEALSVGNPASPSLEMRYPASMQFRWNVRAGARTIQANVLQAINLTPRPTLIVKANRSIGINTDVTISAPSSTGWVVIGPITITPTSTGVVIVELHSNTTAENADGCYWDHIITT